MPIDFRCTNCQKLLRVGDDAAGRHAKCPGCGTILIVPSPAADFDATNPFQSPQVPPRSTPPPIPPRQLGAPRELSFSDIFGRTWTIFKSQAGMCIAAYVVFFAITFCASVVNGLLQAVVERAAQGDPRPGLAVNLVGTIVVNLLQFYLQMGLMQFMLKVARGEPFTFGDAFYTGPQILPFFGATILFGLAAVGGFFLLIVPGIIFMLMFSQVQYLVLDRRTPVLESFSVSQKMMAGNKANLFLIWLLGGLLAMAVMLLTCCLGVLIVGPFGFLAMAVIYLTLSGEATADMESPFAPPPQY